MRGIDFAYGSPGGAAIKRAGYGFVVRYLGGSASKDLTRAEMQDYLAHGLAIGLVWESSAQRMLEGRAAGQKDAFGARAQARAIGAPSPVAIYFAADSGIFSNPIDQPAALAYLDGAADELGDPKLVGAYSGAPFIRAVKAHGPFLLWQTFAWSSGVVVSGIDLYQIKGQAVVNGVTVDRDESSGPAGLWGQIGGDVTETEKEQNEEVGKRMAEENYLQSHGHAADLVGTGIPPTGWTFDQAVKYGGVHGGIGFRIRTIELAKLDTTGGGFEGPVKVSGQVTVGGQVWTVDGTLSLAPPASS